MPMFHIIRALLLTLLTAALLGGCSVARLGYGQLPGLSYWWVDSYLDLNDAQSVPLRSDLQNLLAWHRSQELPQLARALADVQAQSVQDTTPEQMCQIADRFKLRLDAVLAQSELSFARLALTIKPEQLQHLQHQQEKNAQKWREDWLKDSPAEQQKRRLERLVERSEGFYGPLSDAQIGLLRAGVQAAPYDTQLAEFEMLRRNQDLLATLQALAGSGKTPQQAQDAIHALIGRSVQSPNTVYRAQIAQLVQSNCNTFAQLHNSASPAQRQKFAAKLKGYEDDARALMAH